MTIDGNRGRSTAIEMRIIITAGPTREHLDPVRFLSNPSTGKMGFAIAAEAARRGHDVTLVAGPVALKTPDRVHRVDVTSAREMLQESLRSLRGLRGCGGAVFISTAAVADWRPARCAAKKLKKGEMSGTLRLVRNPDILKTIAGLRRAHIPRAKRAPKEALCGVRSRPTMAGVRLVGFAAETNDVLKEAARKCREKGLSFIVANDVTKKGSGFGTDTNQVTFVFPDGTRKPLPLMTKRMVAKRILDEVSRL